MKVGMIFECGKHGADGKIYPYLAKQIRPDIDISPIFLDNKRDLIQGCADPAKSLLEIGGCEHVVIIWDLRPSWKPKKMKLCRVKDCNLIWASLKDKDAH